MFRNLVMTIAGFKSAGDEFIKKLVRVSFSLPKHLFLIAWKIQLKLIYFTVDTFDRIFTILQNIRIFKSILGQKKTSDPEPVVDKEEIVNGAKRLRRSLVIYIDKNYSSLVRSDLNEAVKKLDELRDSIDDDKKFKQAMNGIEEINRPFIEGSWQKRIQDIGFTVDETIEEISETEESETVNLLESKSEKTGISSNFSSVQEIEGQSVAQRETNLNNEQLNVSVAQVHPIMKRRNKSLKNRLSNANSKLHEVLKMSSNLIGELEQLNTQVSNLALMNEKMANMEFELGVGRKLLSEVEADRNEMQKKLETLERMIKEEEQFLDDVSYESGYEESESPLHPEC